MIEIRASSEDKDQAVMDALRSKYTLKFVEGLGVSAHVNKICEISEFEIKSEILIANVTFEAVFYRFYEGEVSIGKIARQEEETFILFDLIMNKYFANIFNNQF